MHAYQVSHDDPIQQQTKKIYTNSSEGYNDDMEIIQKKHS